MGERRKRKSMWDMEDDTKQISGLNEHNSSEGKEHHTTHDSGRDHELSSSRTITAPKSRDHSGQPFWEPNEENRVAPVNDSFVKSRQNSPEGKEISGGNRYYQNMSPGFDGMERHKYKHSLENDRSDSHRRRDRSKSPSRSRSRGRGRERGRSRSTSRSRSKGSPRGHSRSRSPIGDYRNQSHGRNDQRSVLDKSFRICRDFSAGNCRRGSQCRFIHSNNSRDDVSDSYRGEDEQFRNKSRNAVPCREFTKGKCRWGNDCRFSHHFASNETVDEGFRNRNAKNENVSWKIPEFGDIGTAESIDKENTANKPEKLILHGSSVQGQNTSQGDLRNATAPIFFSGGDLDRNGENELLLPGHSSVLNAIDGGQNMTRPDLSNGFSGDLSGPKAQLGARLDLQFQMQSHQKAVQMTGVLETKVTPVTNPTVFPTLRFDNVQQIEHNTTNVQSHPVGVSPRGPISPVENERVTNEHVNYTEQDNQMQVKRLSPLSTVDTKPDYSKVENSGSSKLKQERVDESIADTDEKVTRLFKNSLIEFVKNILKPTWKEGRLSRDVHKTIVKKVVDKVTGTVQVDHIPKTQDKVDQYLSFSKPKIAKLVQAYVERSLKTDS